MFLDDYLMAKKFNNGTGEKKIVAGGRKVKAADIYFLKKKSCPALHRVFYRKGKINLF